MNTTLNKMFMWCLRFAVRPWGWFWSNLPMPQDVSTQQAKSSKTETMNTLPRQVLTRSTIHTLKLWETRLHRHRKRSSAALRLHCVTNRMESVFQKIRLMCRHEKTQTLPCRSWVTRTGCCFVTRLAAQKIIHLQQEEQGTVRDVQTTVTDVSAPVLRVSSILKPLLFYHNQIGDHFEKVSEQEVREAFLHRAPILSLKAPAVILVASHSKQTTKIPRNYQQTFRGTLLCLNAPKIRQSRLVVILNPKAATKQHVQICLTSLCNP